MTIFSKVLNKLSMELKIDLDEQFNKLTMANSSTTRKSIDEQNVENILLGLLSFAAGKIGELNERLQFEISGGVIEKPEPTVPWYKRLWQWLTTNSKRNDVSEDDVASDDSHYDETDTPSDANDEAINVTSLRRLSTNYVKTFKQIRKISGVEGSAKDKLDVAKRSRDVALIIYESNVEKLKSMQAEYKSRYDRAKGRFDSADDETKWKP